MSNKLLSDIDASQARRIFEVLRTDSTLFDECTSEEMDDMVSVLRLLNFEVNDVICKEGEYVDFFVFVAYG